MGGLDVINILDGLDELFKKKILDGRTGCYNNLGRTGRMPIRWDGLDVGRTIDHSANGGADEFLRRFIPDVLPRHRYAANAHDKMDRNRSAHCTEIENACEIWHVYGVEPIAGLPIRRDDVTFIILFGFSPMKYHQIRQNTALMDYYDVNYILNMHSALMANFSMKCFCGPFREWFWDVVRDLDDEKQEFADRSLEIKALLTHLKDSYTMDRQRSRDWYGKPDRLSSYDLRYARREVLRQTYMSPGDLQRELLKKLPLSSPRWPDYFRYSTATSTRPSQH